MYVLENQEPGETAIRFIVPVLRGEEIEGFLASSMRSTTVFSAAAMPSSRVAGLHVQVQCDGQHVYGGPAEPGELAAFGVVAPLPSLPGPRRWVVVVTPGPDYAPAQGSELAEVVLGVSLLTALLLSVSVHSTQEESARAERLETAVRKRTAELARSLLGLRQADEAKDRFISMLGHELRNPLGAVLSATELMPAEHHQHSRALDVIDKEGPICAAS